MTMPSRDNTVTRAVTQGEFLVSGEQDVVLSTVLGSCVACCLHDSERRIGGMNHFLLPDNGDTGQDRPLRYGVFAMETLINALLKVGARKDRLRAKLFGGARIMAEFRDIGGSNAAFARSFLETEHIPCISESLGGRQARRVIFHPHSGKVRMLLVPATEATVAYARPSSSRPAASGLIDLF